MAVGRWIWRLMERYETQILGSHVVGINIMVMKDVILSNLADTYVAVHQLRGVMSQRRIITFRFILSYVKGILLNKTIKKLSKTTICKIHFIPTCKIHI
jgi:hypothetical protein